MLGVVLKKEPKSTVVNVSHISPMSSHVGCDHLYDLICITLRRFVVAGAVLCFTGRFRGQGSMGSGGRSSRAKENSCSLSQVMSLTGLNGWHTRKQFAIKQSKWNSSTGRPMVLVVVEGLSAYKLDGLDGCKPPFLMHHLGVILCHLQL